jgi:DNA replication protein DnaC
MAANLLVVDEMGFQALSREEANLFFRLVSYRYQRGAVCITTNKSIKAWPETFAGDEVLTGVMKKPTKGRGSKEDVRG